MIYAYSPDTGEIINIETPSDWMGTTEIVPPAYTPATEGCFFRDGAWVIVPAAPAPNPRIEQIKHELLALDQKKIRPLAFGDTAYLATLNAQTTALQAELVAL